MEIVNNINCNGKLVNRAEFDQGRLDEFWNFVAERQRIWERRFILKSAPPWTSDKILATQHFTNVYRELDPGTKYAIKNILGKDASAGDRFFNLLIYRLIGKEETHHFIGFQYLERFNSLEFENKLKTIRLQNKHPFTSAYMVSGYKSMGTSDKIVNISRIFSVVHSNFSEFFTTLKNASSFENAYKIVCSLNGFGNFLAYQVLVDATYPIEREKGISLLNICPETWAAAGPGAKKGIRILMGKFKVPDLSVMLWLRNNQKQEFERLGIDFPFIKDKLETPIEISLPNIQNCLCEFYKYVKITEGWGRSRRSFNPRGIEEPITNIQGE